MLSPRPKVQNYLEHCKRELVAVDGLCHNAPFQNSALSITDVRGNNHGEGYVPRWALWNRRKARLLTTLRRRGSLFGCCVGRIGADRKGNAHLR